MPNTILSGGCGSCGLVGGCPCNKKGGGNSRKTTKKSLKGGCGSCGLVGGCGCDRQDGGKKKKITKTKKEPKKGGSLFSDLIDSAKTLSVPLSFILAKQALQDKFDKHKPSETKTKKKKSKKNKKSKVGGGNILNVMN